MNSRYNNIGAKLKSIGGEVRAQFTAGTTGDATSSTSSAIDLTGVDSVKLVYTAQCTLTAAKSLDITPNITNSTTSGGSYSTYKLLDKQTIGGPLTADVVTVEYDLDTEALTWMKVVTTADLTNTGTDTASYTLTVIKGGYKTAPITKSPKAY